MSNEFQFSLSCPSDKVQVRVLPTSEAASETINQRKMMLESHGQPEQFNQSCHYELISNPSPSSLDRLESTDYGYSTSVNDQYKYWNPAASIDVATINNDHLVTLDSISHEQMKKSVDQLIGELCAPLWKCNKKNKRREEGENLISFDMAHHTAYFTHSSRLRE